MEVRKYKSKAEGAHCLNLVPHFVFRSGTLAVCTMLIADVLVKR
jgi:hypothetical protein